MQTSGTYNLLMTSNSPFHCCVKKEVNKKYNNANKWNLLPVDDIKFPIPLLCEEGSE